jgi:hypothetical protein
MAIALLRFQVATEAFRRGVAGSLKDKLENPLNAPLPALVQDKLAADPEFWRQLFEQKLPHPLDTHPSLHVRLEALGQNISTDEARNIALEEFESAYAKWFSTRDSLFEDLAQQAQTMMGKMRLAQADYQTPEGKALLEQSFPEKNWIYKPFEFWGRMVLLGVLLALALAGVFFISDSAPRLIIGLVGVMPAIATVQFWRRHRHGKLTLTAEGIFYSGWLRPLRFREVERIFARRHHSEVTLMLHLKEKQPPIWKHSLLRARAKVVNLSLGNLGEKPLTIAQIIFRYMTRQTEAGKPAADAAAAG